ncbi:MAG: potassium-transporting ATPase subunit KdpA [Deltaproteobacteria bacterium HGW-Deltaproteobacteria-1]|nr:MAG: potassium-transporting ATPase subunit KdpA [Deltaproteobacteria bacterium HGW-Deltaproteobacteria-1]
MTTGNWLCLILFPFIITILAYPMGIYMAKVFSGDRTFLSPVIAPVERFLYRIFTVEPNEEMSWKTYTLCLVLLNVIGIVALFCLQLIQGWLPFNPQKFGAVRWDTALNAAVSFGTNTNWQTYSGERTMSYLTQMMGMTVQNFISAAIGIVAVIAVIRGFVRKSAAAIGNFWVDLTRCILYVLLPLVVILSFILVSQGAVQTLSPSIEARTLEGRAIKQIGTNGGGFFNTNSAHPFENPTPLTDFLEVLGLLLIAAALPFTLGAMLKNRRQGFAVFAAMMILYLTGLGIFAWTEMRGNPLLEKAGIASGMNMEGKETRFGVVNSALFAQSTTVTSCGAVNSMHDSMLPLSGIVLLFNMAIGEVIFGGVGTGLIGMLSYAILTLFLAGLMIGRTPEFMGKKLELLEMVMAVVIIVTPAILQLILSSIAVSTQAGVASLGNTGPHGLSEIIYAFASASGNNGSAFAGLNANTVFYNLTTSLAMLIGRFSTILPALAIAGNLAEKKIVPESVATFPTASLLFTFMLIAVVIVVGALTFFPVLTLGPLLEHLLLAIGKTF